MLPFLLRSIPNTPFSVPKRFTKMPSPCIQVISLSRSEPACTPCKGQTVFLAFFFFWLFRVCILTPAAPDSHKSSHRPSGRQGRGASRYSFIYTDGGGWPRPRASSGAGVGGPAAASPGNLLERQSLSTHPRPRNLKLQGGTHRLITEEFWSSSFRTSALENQQDRGTDPEPRMSTLQLHTTVHRGEPRSGAVCDKTRVLT